MLNKRATEPFKFYISSLLISITGRKARHLKEFVNILKSIDESSIFFHVHHSFRDYRGAPGIYNDEFARWIYEDLGEQMLAEKLGSINVRDFTNLNDLRTILVKTIEDYLDQAVEIRKCPPGREFVFCKSITIVSPTKYQASTLDEFVACLRKVGMRSIYYHYFDARLRLGKKTDDFSNWIRNSFGDEELASKIERLDPYVMSMDVLRDRIIYLIQQKQPGLQRWAGGFYRWARKKIKW